MRNVALVAAVMGFAVSSAAFASELLDPVRDVMAIAIHNAIEAPQRQDKAYLDYFDPNSLMMHYSVAFTRDLVAAVMHAKANHEQMSLTPNRSSAGRTIAS